VNKNVKHTPGLNVNLATSVVGFTIMFNLVFQL